MASLGHRVWGAPSPLLPCLLPPPSHWAWVTAQEGAAWNLLRDPPNSPEGVSSRGRSQVIWPKAGLMRNKRRAELGDNQAGRASVTMS